MVVLIQFIGGKKIRLTLENIERQFITVGDVRLHVITAGDKTGEPVILLHGFPEFWYGWRKQIPYLVEKGYRVIVPDQRGYNLSDKPKNVADYDIDLLAQDVVSLATALGYERFNLVGHDWGAAVSWWVATLFPERLEKLVILNVPYPRVMNRAAEEGNWAQILKSWYIAFFQIPYLPESILSFNDFEVLAQSVVKSGKAGTFHREEIDAYIRAWSQPKALTSTINWYRAIGQRSLKPSSGIQRKVQIKPPTLILWGEQDKFLGKELVQPSLDLCLDGQAVFFPEATHWLQHDEADAVNREIDTFLKR